MRTENSAVTSVMGRHEVGVTHGLNELAVHGQDMNEIAIGSTLAFLLVLQGFLVLECIRMKGTVSDESSSLKSSITTIGEMLDEALDYIADSPSVGSTSPIPSLTQAGGGFKEMLLNGLIENVLMRSGHAETEQTEREVLQIEREPTSEQIQERIQHQERSGGSSDSGRTDEDSV